MEAKTYIRQYEELKNKKAGDLDSKQVLEKEWIKLFKDMNFAMKKMSKKQKEQLTVFQKKTLEEMHKNSSEIYKFITNKTDFKQKVKLNEKVYFKSGSKGLIEVIFESENFELTFDDKIKEIKKNEVLKTKPLEKCIEELTILKNTSIKTLEEAYKTEKQIMDLYKWWNANHNNLKNKELAKSFYDGLGINHINVINSILNNLGYEATYEECFKSKSQKKLLKDVGFLKACQTIEQQKYNNFILNPTEFILNKEIIDNFSFIPPDVEFKNVRKMNRHFIIHVGPTNSGKTYEAIEALKKSDSGIYLAPIRLLAMEIQDKLTKEGILCDLKTGEEKINVEGSKHQSSIIEIVPFSKKFDVAVVDEVQMIEDPIRGSAWVRSIFGLKAKEIHLCGSEHALPFLLKIIELCGDTVEVIKYQRQTELVVEEELYHFPYSTRKGDALIAFGKKQVIEKAEELKKLGYKVSIMYGKLPPDTRKEQVELFTSGQTDVIVTTDAIGIGLNLPIERVVFLETKKFDGIESRDLTIQEVKQIAGRAGRKGIYEKGFVNAVSEKQFIKRKLEEKEKVITGSVISPSDDIFNLKKGTLRQRFSAWKQAELNVPYLEKADIEKQIMLLSQIEKWEHELDEGTIIKTLYITFDTRNNALIRQWKKYVEEVKNKKTSLTKPVLKGNDLTSIENYYHSISLYYNFSNKLNINYDGRWVKEEKKRVSGLIKKSILSRKY